VEEYLRRFIVGLGAAILLLPAWSLRSVAADEDASKPEFFATRVQPVFQASCYRCHGGMNHRGGLSMATRAGMLKGGHDGPVLVPGDPERSLLVRLMRRQGPAGDPMPMPPPPRPKVSDADIATVERWVRAGAVMPQDQPKP